MTQTKITNVIVPEVMADMISYALPSKLAFSQIATIDNTLVGQPGDTITVPSWTYIGDATDVAEGVAITPDVLASTKKTMTIKKAAKGVEITDEAVNRGMGDPIGEAQNQLLLSLANKIDNDLVTDAKDAKSVPQHIDLTSGTQLTIAKLQAGADLFADEDLEDMALYANPADATRLRDEWVAAHPSADVAANVSMAGAIAKINGVNIFKSNKVTARNPFLVKLGSKDEDGNEVTPAFKIFMKSNAQVELDRDILKKTTVLTADEHYGAYVYDASKVVRFVGLTA